MRPPGPRRTGGPTISRRRPLTRSSIDVGRIVPEGIRPHKRIQFGARRLATTHPRGTSTNRRVRKSSARCPVETTSRSSLRNGNSRPTLICRITRPARPTIQVRDGRTKASVAPAVRAIPAGAGRNRRPLRSSRQRCPPRSRNRGNPELTFVSCQANRSPFTCAKRLPPSPRM
jgi:hypothetical protein